MRLVIVNTNRGLVDALRKCAAAVAPHLPRRVCVDVVSAPLHECLAQVHGATVLVLPANSAAFMGGGFDRAIVAAVAPHADPKRLEAAIQQQISARWGGYLPVGNAHTVDLAQACRAANVGPAPVAALVLAPTMAVPGPIAPRAVFDSVWSVLAEVGRRYDTVVLPAFGAGHGGVGPETVAQTMLGAIGLFYMDAPAMARTAAVLLFTRRDRGRFGLAGDIAQLEAHLTDYGRAVSTDGPFPMPWDELAKSVSVLQCQWRDSLPA